MARARNIKPGFFTNDELAETGPEGMVLFAGLWCLADRAGRLEDRPRRIKAEVLPYFDVDVDALLSALESRGFIRRYTVESEKYIQIVRFDRNQSPHIKEAPSTIPAPDEHQTSTGKESLIPDSTTDSTAATDSARGEQRLPPTTVRTIGRSGSGAAAACAFAAAVGEETFTTIAENFVGVNPQLDRAWLARTLSRFEVEGLSLPPPATKHALKQAYLKAQDALGREGNRISHPQAWTAKQIETALRDEARAVTA